MSAERKLIPLHRLEQETDQGYMLERVNASGEALKQAVVMEAHRDDHYIFLLQETGKSKGMVDFQSFTIGTNTILFILPGQPHHYLKHDKKTSGWFVALSPGLVPDVYRAVLENPLLGQQQLSTCADVMQTLSQCLQLADTMRQLSPTPHSRQVIYTLLSSFVGMVTDLYARRQDVPAERKPRSKMITQEFRQLLNQRYKTVKSPGEYAAAMHLSLSYLNEAVKDATGWTVSYWIQQAVMLEAKRLLYYSPCSVKEIAHELGYEDHTYFSRLFKKITGRTPGEFRQSYHR